MKRSHCDENVRKSFVPRQDTRGNKLCERHACPNILKGRQERWCSKSCVFDAMATWDWSICRKRIIKRDKFQCVNCGASAQRSPFAVLEVDHIVPVCEGGRLCDPENLRTLCAACHKVETAALASRRAESRRLTKKFGVVC